MRTLFFGVAATAVIFVSVMSVIVVWKNVQADAKRQDCAAQAAAVAIAGQDSSKSDCYQAP
jgi:Na+-transporting methylmalonyl-CoA/oxaloacetate decarboxylase beta subunit